MDGFDTRKGVIIMAATNRPEILDPALIRAGRFDRQILVDRPSLMGREDILKIHTREVKLDPDVNLHTIAARTPGMVGSDLANIVNEAALLAARKSREAVTMQDFEDAIDRVVAGLEKRNRMMNPKEKEIVAYHETGHALVAEGIPGLDPVHRVSIIPRGIGALGYTMQLPTEDRYLMTKGELEDRMAVMLGGRVAEEVHFGEISTGAQNDLYRATDIARSMVREYGMSEKLGPLTFERERRPLFLETMMPPSAKDYSEATAQQIDQEVSSLVARAHKRAKEILEAKRDTLEKVARVLLDKEVLEGEELRRLLNEHPKEA
jgi:cell division protease FtsH